MSDKGGKSRTSTITLSVDRGVWVARFGGPAGEDVRGLFGEDRLPTPYMADVPAVDVAERIAARNPGVEVYLGAMRFRPSGTAVEPGEES